MASVAANTIFWEVDVQVDFMLPGGKLYVPGAEKIVPNINQLVDYARKNRVFLISSADAHNLDDPELREWPPHCLKGTPGAGLLPEACAEPRLVIPNQMGFGLPKDLNRYRQVTLEKNTLNVFDNPNTDVLLAKLNPEGKTTGGAATDPLFVVFGVATEYCVRCTVEELLRRGWRVAIVGDAVRAIEQQKGDKIVESLRSHGAQMIDTKKALFLVEHSAKSRSV